MKVSRAFLNDFAFVANFYDWTDRDVEEVKEQTRGNPELMKYWRDLAAAHRAGYKQTRSNNWQRLGEWQQTNDDRRREPREIDWT